MKYLGKKYLTNWIKGKGTNTKATEYGKIRSDEWLKGKDFYLYCCQGEIINLYVKDEKKDYEVGAEKTYHLQNGNWILKAIKVYI